MARFLFSVLALWYLGRSRHLAFLVGVPPAVGLAAVRLGAHLLSSCGAGRVRSPPGAPSFSTGSFHRFSDCRRPVLDFVLPSLRSGWEVVFLSGRALVRLVGRGSCWSASHSFVRLYASPLPPGPLASLGLLFVWFVMPRIPRHPSPRILVGFHVFPY